jgi:hypothetical protein
MSVHQPPAGEAAPAPGQPVRSEGLLPAEPEDLPEVAEEVHVRTPHPVPRTIQNALQIGIE